MQKTPALLKKRLRDGLLLAMVGLSVAAGSTAAQAAPAKLMLYGDSLMAGYGLGAEDGFAGQLQAALAADGFNVTIVNASVSGDTSADALARLDWSLSDRPDAVLVGLGGNDMLQALPPAQLDSNLQTILKRFAAEDVPALLLGMQASPGLGADYVTRFNAVYPQLAAQFGVPLYGFFLEGVATNPAFNQADRIHPNAEGVARIVQRVLPDVERLLASIH